ncbi:MAG TPA: adenylate kinase [Chitinophagaceae bacterium]|nr:adenylate kinase [Chitinophagaceae bacterium]
MFNIILFGPPGSGKGTQSEYLIKNFGLTHVSTGDLLRSEIENKTELGLEAKKFIDEGQLVPDSVVIGMIKDLYTKKQDAKGFIFDGFPRTVEQAKALDTFLKEKNAPIQVLISLDVPTEELKKRLIERGKISGRTDDNEETIALRIQEYLNKTKPVEEHYKQQDKLKVVEGTGSISSISENIASLIKAFVSV